MDRRHEYPLAITASEAVTLLKYTLLLLNLSRSRPS